MRRSLAISAVATWVLLVPAVGEARAYIDPGTGSSLFASLGVLLGVMTAVCAVGLAQIKRFAMWCVSKLTGPRREEPLTPELSTRRK